MRWVAFVLAVLALFPLQAEIDARKPELPSSLLYTPDRRLMSVIACGHGATLADLVWLQSTNYVMSEFQSGRTHIEHLYALYDVMTELDPDFVDAYVMGAVFLSSIADDPERSIPLLEKGEGPLDDDGQEITERKAPNGEELGRIHPLNKQRWKLLSETAATHLVSFAGYAPTIAERHEEIRAAGRYYTFGAKRYPRDVYPDRPDWYEAMGKVLSERGRGSPLEQSEFTDRAWLSAVKQIWEQRLYFTPPSSPLFALYKRRVDELESRLVFSGLKTKLDKWKKDHPEKPVVVAEMPKDPLGVGYFLVRGELVAPGLDAELVARQLSHDVARFQHEKGRYPSSREELFAASPKAASIPPWVQVSYEPTTGTVATQALPPR